MNNDLGVIEIFRPFAHILNPSFYSKTAPKTDKKGTIFMFIINSVDEVKQEEGIWKSYGGAQFLIAYARNNQFVKTLNRLRKPYQKQIDKGTLDTKIADGIYCESMASGLLLDWKDVYDDTGDKIAYSKEIAKAALMNDPDFREFISEVSTELENYRKEDIEDKVKKRKTA